MSDTRAWLDEQQDIMRKATPAPWARESDGQIYASQTFAEAYPEGDDGQWADSDAEAIIAARTGYPKALATIRAVLELTDIASLAMPDGKDPYWVSHVRNAITAHLEDR